MFVHHVDGHVRCVERADHVVPLADVIADLPDRAGSAEVADHRNDQVSPVQILDEPECIVRREKTAAVAGEMSEWLKEHAWKLL